MIERTENNETSPFSLWNRSLTGFPGYVLLFCVLSGKFRSQDSRISGLQLKGGRTYFFVVDGYLPHSFGVHRLFVRRTGGSEIDGELQRPLGAPGTTATPEDEATWATPTADHRSYQPFAVGAGVARSKGSGCFGECSRRMPATREAAGEGRGSVEELVQEETDVEKALGSALLLDEPIWILSARNDSVSTSELYLLWSLRHFISQVSAEA